MLLGEIGRILLALAAVLILGNLWFHLVEWALGRIKGHFLRQKDSPAWHSLLPEQEEKDDI